MFTYFLFNNIAHFALTVLGAFVFFTTGWIYFDSWRVDRTKNTPFVRSIGFFILAIVTASHATTISQPIIQAILYIGKLAGLILITLSLLKEPVLKRPDQKMQVPLLSVGGVLLALYVIFSTLLTFIIAFLYFRKATKGLEKQLKPAALAFLLLSLSEFIRIFYLWSDTSFVFWSRILAEYNLIWYIEHLLQLAGILILGWWAVGYLRFRIHAQLFIISVSSSLLIFLVTTFFLTFLLLKNLENDALSHLKTDVRVLQYAIERLQQEALSDSRAVANDSAVKLAFLDNDSTKLYEITSSYLLTQNTSFLTVVQSSGKVVMRAEDRERIGDTVLDDKITKSALSGQPLSTVTLIQGILAPQIQIKAAVPIFKSNPKDPHDIVGVVVTGFTVDNAFVDGIKEVTDLDASVYGGDTQAATTFVAPDGTSRFVGTKEHNVQILKIVLGQGEIFIGSTNVLNQPFFTAYSPLKSLNNEIIGMLFVGKPQTTLIQTAQRSVELTFLGSIICMILSILPSYFVSRYIYQHLKA